MLIVKHFYSKWFNSIIAFFFSIAFIIFLLYNFIIHYGM